MGEEEKGMVTLYADGKPLFSASLVELPTMELAEVEDCEDCYYGVKKEEAGE